jgi:hypothetical protein
MRGARMGFGLVSFASDEKPISSIARRALTVASVLVVAIDPNIESLLGEFLALSGHRPVVDSTLGAAGESVRRSRPDVCLLDNWLSPPVLDLCLEASDEVGAPAILISSTESDVELAEAARKRHCLHFSLRDGAKHLADVLERALAAKRASAKFAPPTSYCTQETSPVHPALCAAIANVARARALTRRASVAMAENRQFRDEGATLLAEARRSRDGLRAAVADYAAHLKAIAIPVDRVVEMVTTALTDCAFVVGAEECAALVAADSRQWALEAYQAV